MIKRIFDFIVSLTLLVMFSPVLLIIAIAIVIDSKGSIFFKQTRVGKNGKLFWVYKFRTLKNTSPKLHVNTKVITNIDNFVFPAPPEEEKTKIGNFLRKTSINEIPQLINVLKGEMSLVGPRPEVPEIVNLYEESYKKRLLVKPGITGLAQVEGRGDLPLKDIIQLDLKYIDKLSFLFDLKILLKTILVVYSKDGAK